MRHIGPVIRRLQYRRHYSLSDSAGRSGASGRRGKRVLDPPSSRSARINAAARLTLSSASSIIGGIITAGTTIDLQAITSSTSLGPVQAATFDARPTPRRFGGAAGNHIATLAGVQRRVRLQPDQRPRP